MRVSKPLIYANLTTLTLNGVMLCLMAIKAFPPLLGIVLIIVFLAGSVYLSCYLNGQMPKRRYHVPFHAAPTRKSDVFLVVRSLFSSVQQPPQLP